MPLGSKTGRFVGVSKLGITPVVLPEPLAQIPRPESVVRKKLR